MSNRIRIARGSAGNKPSDLMYGEFYWEKIAAGTSEGVLYMGTPDGSTTGSMAVGGARAMKSWYYKGIWSTAGSFPSTPVMGDMYLMGVNGTNSLSAFKTGDMMIFDGTSSWLRINNVGGDAVETAYTNTTSGLAATNVQDAIDEVALKRFQYGGTFSAASTAYPSTPKPGKFYISTDIGVVNSTSYKKGDAAFYDGTSWSMIPFSQAFPADGIQGTGTSGKIAKFNGTHGVADSNISDSSTKVTIAVDTTVTGILQGNQLKIGDGVSEQATISVPSAVGNISLNLPSLGGTLMRTADHLPASQVDYTHTGTALVATDVQAAITEMAKGKMAYAGTIAAGPGYPSSPVIGGLYLITADVNLGATTEPVFAGTDYVKGDWSFYDGQTWVRIPAGYTDAINTSFDNTGVKFGDGTTSVTETNVQTALAKLFTKKADLDGNGLVPTSQLPAAIVGGMTYKGSFDASTTTYPTGATQGNYWVVSVAGVVSGVDYEIGDWAVYNGATQGWSKIDNSDKLSGIIVGASTLVGTPTIAGSSSSGISVTAASGTITIAAGVASASQLGVVKTGDGIAVTAGGKISVDATDGLHIDTNGKLATYLNTNGLEIDANQMLGIKAAAEFTFPASGGDAGKLALANTGVAADTYTKVTVNAKGQVTGGASLLVGDVPIADSGATLTTNQAEIYNDTTGVISAIEVGTGASLSKASNLITIGFGQTNATGFSAKFGVTAPTDFDWSARATTTTAITSLLGAVNANREDLDQYVALLRTKGAAIGTAAGANLIGTAGIADVTPTGGAVADDATLQAMLEGLKAYTDTAVSNFDALGVVEVGTTGTAGRVAIFTGTDKIGDSKIGATNSLVTVDVPMNVSGDLTVQRIGTGGSSTSSKLKLEVGGGSYVTSVVATAVNGNLALSLPSKSGVEAGTLLADFSMIDCGDYDL